MNLSYVERIAHAVLYEGYMLYPYRPSAVKNRQRWNFGIVYPQAHSLVQSGPAAAVEACHMQTECLVQGDPYARLDVRIRFLHVLARSVGELMPASIATPVGDLHFHIVDVLEVGGRRYQTWQEAFEREARASGLTLEALVAQPLRLEFAFASSQEKEMLHDASGRVVGVVVHEQQGVEGAVEIAATPAGDRMFKLTVRILNLTPFESPGEKSRDEVLMRSLVSTHTILSTQDGAFVSVFDPPDSLRAAADACQNVGTWPVLVGEMGARDTLLSSPIILYDYPQVAPESTGDLFDATEIDEILTLRIMTLTDDEKREMRDTDEHARQLLERTETIPTAHLMKLHGAVRGLRPLQEEKP
jgi:hydrogenase maturation protease